MRRGFSTRLELYKVRDIAERSEKEVEAGCYNKAVSAAYFSVRLTAESMLDIKTKRDDKIANAVRRLLEEVVAKEAEEAWRYYMIPSEKRRLAGHRRNLHKEGS